MNIDVNKLSPQASKYWHYVIGKIVKPSPIHAGDTARFSIKESSPYFPEFAERPVIFNTIKLEKRLAEDGEIRRVPRRVSPLEQEVSQAHDEDGVREGKIGAIMWFTQRKLDGMCALRSATISDDGPINIKFVFKILDTIKIYREAGKLGIKILRGKNLSKYYTEFPSEFLENPPRIKWGMVEIELPTSGLELDICRVACRPAAGEPMYPWDIMGEVDRERAKDEKSGGRAVYNSIRRINKLVKKQTHKTLFKWTRNAFYRNA